MTDQPLTAADFDGYRIQQPLVTRYSTGKDVPTKQVLAHVSLPSGTVTYEVRSGDNTMNLTADLQTALDTYNALP